MGYADSIERLRQNRQKSNNVAHTSKYEASMAKLHQEAAEKYRIKSLDANNDSIVDIRDVVRAKKITNNSNEYAQEINKQATDAIKKTIVSTDYFSGDFNGDLVVDKKDEKIYKQNEELRKADVGALQAELDKLKVILENAESKKSNTSKARANTLTKKGAASIEAFKQKDSLQQDYEEYLKSVGYSSIEELQKDVTEKTAFLNTAKRVQNRIKLSSVDDSSSENYDPDFNKYKEEGYKVSYKDIGNEILSFGGGMAASGVAVDNYKAAALALYEHLGNEIPKKYTQKDTDDKISIFREMSFEEFRRFAYYLGKDKENGTDSAEEYIDAITDELNYRRGSEIADDIKDRDILRYLYAVPAGLDQFATGIQSLFNVNGEYKPTSAIQYTSSQIGEEIYKEDGELGKGIYDLGTTTVNMLPSILAGAAANLVVPGASAVVGAGLMGASAGGNGYQEMINLGYDKKQAQAYGVLVGASEAALGYAFGGISAIGGKVTGNVLKGILDGIDNGLAKFAIKYGGSMLSEGLEEAAQEILTPLFENIALQYDKNSFKDINWDEVIYSGLLGAISAGLLEFAPAASNAKYEADIAKAEKLSFYGSKTDGSYSPENAKRAMQIFADEALAGNPIDSEAYQLALKYKQRLDNNKKLSGTQLHKLREVYESAIKENDKVKIKNAVAARLEELGETANIPELSDIITRGVAGEKVTRAEENTVKSSKYGTRVTNELNPVESIRKNYSNYWTELIETERIHSDVYNKQDVAKEDNAEIAEVEETISKTPDGMNDIERGKLSELSNAKLYNFGLTVEEAEKIRKIEKIILENEDERLNDLEDKILEKSDNQLTPKEKAIKAIINERRNQVGKRGAYNKRAIHESLKEDADTFKNQGKFVKPVEEQAEVEVESTTDGVESGKSQKITLGMSESERYGILKNRKIVLAETNVDAYNNAIKNRPELLNESLKKTTAKGILKKIGSEFGIFRNYTNEDIELEFEFGKNNLDESVNKQKGNHDIFAKMLSCFSDVINNAVGIEVHNRNNQGYKTDRTLKQMYVLCSAFVDGDTIIPVKLEVKEFTDKPNRLYVAVALDGIKRDRVVSMGVPNNRSHVRTSPVTISIRDLFSKINPKDIDFLKYIPNEFLNEEQIKAKTNKYKSDLDSMLDESDSTPQEDTDEREVFTEPSSKEIHRKATEEEGWNIFLGVYENNVRQKHITDVAKKLDPDMKVIWAAKNDDRLSGKNGKYIRSINTMILSKDASVAEMYFEVFKHEFMHRLESKGSYIAFKKYLFDRSTAFEQYVRAQLKIINKGKKFDGSREEAISALTKYYFDKFQNDKSIGKQLKDKFTLEDAQREIVADFAGEVLFKGKANRESIAKALSKSNEDMLTIGEIESTVDALEELAKTDRNLFQKIMDVIKDFIRMLRGQPQTKSLVKDLEYIEKRLARVYDSRDTKKAAKNSGDEQFSLNIKHTDGTVEKLKDAHDLTNQQAITYLNQAKRGELRGHSYIPVRKDTPKVVIDTLENAGEKIENLSLIMQVRKAQQAMSNKNNGGKSKSGNNVRPHALSAEEIVEILNNLDYPSTIILQTNRYNQFGEELPNNVAVFVEYTNDNKEGLAVIEFESSIDPEFIGKEVGDTNFHTVVTVFEPDMERDGMPFDYVEELLQNPDNFELDIVRRQSIRSVTQEKHPNTSKELPSNDIIDDIVPTVNSKSMQESENNSSKTENEEGQFSTGSPMQQARENLARYESGEISREEYLEGLEENFHTINDKWKKRNKNLKDRWTKRAASLEDKIVKEKERQRAEVKAEVKAEVRAEREEKANKQSNIEHIRKTVSRIDKMFRTNSDQKHIPEKLKEASAYFIKIFVNNDASPFDKIQIRNIRTLYNDLYTKGEDGVEISGIDTKTLESLEELEEKLEGKTLRQLNNAEILLIKEITDNFYHIIKDENEVFIEGKKQKLAGIGQRCIEELKAKKAKRENALMRQLDANIKYGNMIPIYFFEEIGGVLNEAFAEVVKAQEKWYRNVEGARKHILSLKKKYHYKDWDDKTLKLTTEKGDDIEITREQAMLLVATARREYGNKYKESMHLLKGGIVIPPSKETIADIVKRYNKVADKDAEETKTRQKIAKEIDSRAHRITPKDAQAVLEWLTDEQVEYVKEMTDYLSNDMAALGNEISMELAGIKKYGEKNYIPYNSAENFLFSQPGVNQEARLKHQSFTKDTQHRANTPIVLSDFSTVCADHINRMCMYNAFTIPLENMNKIFNYQSKGEDTDTLDVKAEIERVYGQSAVKYIKDFLSDMNGNVRNEVPNSLMAKILRLFKKGAVFASASVVVQQPSAVMRAMTYIDPKYFTETTFKFAERSFKEATEWSAVAGIKQMGRFDTGMGATTTEWLLYEKPEGLKNKTKAFFDVSDSTYRDDFLSAPAAKADELAWGHIWAAVKAEIADTTDLKQGSKEFFKACGERFTEVINYTQVYDSTISRSQNMRNKSITAQMLTAFMSEPTVTLNCLMKAIREAKVNSKDGKKFAGRAIAALIGNVILNSLLKSIITAGRDDDEDYTYLEKYAANVLQNMWSDINPFSMVPYIKDIVSVFGGYTVERADMSLFSDLAQSVRDINSNNKSVLQKTESLAGSLAAFLGLPVKNVLRDVRTVYNIVMDMKRNLSNGKTDSDWMGVWYALNESSDTEIFADLAKAAEDGDEEKYQRIYKHLSDNGKSDVQIVSGIKKAYSNSEEIKTEAQQYLDKLKGNKTYETLDDEDKEKVRKEITSKLTLQKTVVAIFNNSSRFDTLYSYYRRGQSEKYNKLKKELADEGFTASQISNGFEYARLSYMQTIGVDIHEYLLFKKVISKKYADTDDSGSVEKSEKKKAINNMDSNSKVKNFFINEYK